MKIFSKKVLKWIGIVAGAVIAILLVANALWVWRTGSRLEEKLAALRAEGEPLSLADLAREAIPPEKNAAVFLRRARDDVSAVDHELVKPFRGEGASPEEVLKAYRAALDAYPDVIPLLEQAAACPEYVPNIDYSVGTNQFLTDLRDRTQATRSVFRVLSARVRVLTAEGERDKAMYTCLTMFRLERHVEHEPILMSYLVSLACRGLATGSSNHVLQSGPVSQQMRKSLEEELALCERLEGFQWALKAERAYGLEFFRTMPGWCTLWLVGRPLWNDGTCYYLDMIDRHMAAASRPYSEVVATTPAPARHWLAFRRLTDLADPAIAAGRAGLERSRATIRCLRVLNALQARPEQPGAETPKLADLGLPADATTDPFTGRPLHLKKLPDGWLIYSVGKDLKDDGGDFTEARDVGVGPPHPAPQSKPTAEDAEGRRG